jgi:hypothetical protein
MDYFYAGFASGISQTLIGYPFDTLKVWSQNYAKINPPKRTFTNLYRGIQYPLLQAPFLTGISFGVYNRIYQQTENTYIAGSFAGVVSSIVHTPLDFYKIGRQQQQSTTLGILPFDFGMLLQCARFLPMLYIIQPIITCGK